MSLEEHFATMREDTALLADWAEEQTAMSSVDADQCRERILHAAQSLLALANRATELEGERDEALRDRDDANAIADQRFRFILETERERDKMRGLWLEAKENAFDARLEADQATQEAEAMAEYLERAREAMDEVDRMFVFGWRRNDVPQRSKEVIERWDVVRTMVGCER